MSTALQNAMKRQPELKTNRIMIIGWNLVEIKRSLRKMDKKGAINNNKRADKMLKRRRNAINTAELYEK